MALVTGASRRLGRQIALDLARHGFDIAVHFRGSVDEANETVEALRQAGAGARAFQADLSDEAACRALLPEVAAHFGRVDAVVNNASTFEDDNAASFSMTTMDTHWRANTAPAVILAQALHAHLEADSKAEADTNSPNAPTNARQGCVVNLLDQKLWNPNPDHFSYTLSKAALQAATVMLAQALAPRVRVCGVAPGVTLPSGPMSADEFAKAHRMTPLGRSSDPDDIARAVRFMLESKAVTGTTLLVDGGQHLNPQPRDVFFLSRTR